MTASRLDRLVTALGERGCEAAVLVGADHAVHMAGYSRLFSGPVATVVDGDGRRTLVTPAYEVEAAWSHAEVDEVVGYGEVGFGLDPEPMAAFSAAVAGLLPAGAVGVAGEPAGVAEAAAKAAGAQAQPITDVIAEIRLRKDPDEVERIARAYALALSAQSCVAAGTRVGAREIDLYSEAGAHAQREAGAPVDFHGDLLVGARSALVCGPVAVPGDARAEAGDVLVSDLSVRHRGYWGDTARTHVVGSNDEAAEVRAAIKSVLDDTAAMLRPGVQASDVFAAVAQTIGERFPGGRFPHHAGHGVGVTALEDPHLIPRDDSLLQEGMVLAVEPGVYLPGRFGVRVENMYLVTPDGGVDLRALPGV
jgi:Xaa-Pro dipeptidase